MPMNIATFGQLATPSTFEAALTAYRLKGGHIWRTVRQLEKRFFHPFRNVSLMIGGADESTLVVIALQAGCQQKPSPGMYIGLDGEIFSPTAIRISAPSPTALVDPAWFDQGPLTVGAKVGIAAGCLVVLLMLIGCAIVCNGKRRRKAYLRSIEPKMTNTHTNNINTDNKITINTALGWPSSVSQPPLQGYNDSPLSQRPLREWHNSPLTAQSDTSFSRHFSPYSSQYNSPISAQDAALIQWPPVALTPNQPIGAAVTVGDDPVHTWGSPVDAKGKSREEAYEMYMVDSRGNGNV